MDRGEGRAGAGGVWGHRVMGVTRAHLLVVLYEKLAGLELLGVHHVQQLPPCSIGRLQILPVELLHSKGLLKAEA